MTMATVYYNVRATNSFLQLYHPGSELINLLVNGI